MEVRGIQPNNFLNNKSLSNGKNVSFRGVVNVQFFRSISKDPIGDAILFLPKIKDIRNTNLEHFEISGGTFDSSSRVAKFYLTGTKFLDSVPGLESVGRVEIPSKGWDFIDALLNIDLGCLKDANEALRRKYLRSLSVVPQRYVEPLKLILKEKLPV